MVAAACGHFLRTDPLHRLRDVGGLSGKELLGRAPLPFALLLTGDIRQLPAFVFRTEARLVAGLAALLARAADPARARVLPLHLLLLSRRLLQSLLGRSARMRGGRAAQ